MNIYNSNVAFVGVFLFMLPFELCILPWICPFLFLVFHYKGIIIYQLLIWSSLGSLARKFRGCVTGWKPRGKVIDLCGIGGCLSWLEDHFITLFIILPLYQFIEFFVVLEWGKLTIQNITALCIISNVCTLVYISNYVTSWQMMSLGTGLSEYYRLHYYRIL